MRKEPWKVIHRLAKANQSQDLKRKKKLIDPFSTLIIISSTLSQCGKRKITNFLTLFLNFDLTMRIQKQVMHSLKKCCHETHQKLLPSAGKWVMLELISRSKAMPSWQPEKTYFTNYTITYDLNKWLVIRRTEDLMPNC